MRNFLDEANDGFLEGSELLRESVEQAAAPRIALLVQTGEQPGVEPADQRLVFAREGGTGIGFLCLERRSPNLAALFLGERPSRLQIVGAAIALAGLGVIGLARMQGAAALIPFAMCLAAAFAWSVANIR
jgi:hypothetical protein